MNARPRRKGFDLRRELWRIAGVLAALVLLNLATYLFLNLPRLRSLESLRTERDEVRRSLRAANDRSETMRTLLARYDEEVVLLDDFYKNRLGDQLERMTTIQKAIRTIASEFRIDPDAIDYNIAEVEGTDLTQFQITVPLIGGYPNLRQFLNRIEAADHIVIIDSVELGGSKEGGAMLNLAIRISTYFRAPEREGRRGDRGVKGGA